MSLKGRPHPKPGSHYRILAVGRADQLDLVGRVLTIDSYQGVDGLVEPYVRCTGHIVGSAQLGTIAFTQGVALEHFEPPPCRCLAFTFPHKRSYNCLENPLPFPE